MTIIIGANTDHFSYGSCTYNCICEVLNLGIYHKIELLRRYRDCERKDGISKCKFHNLINMYSPKKLRYKKLGGTNVAAFIRDNMGGSFVIETENHVIPYIKGMILDSYMYSSPYLLYSEVLGYWDISILGREFKKGRMYVKMFVHGMMLQPLESSRDYPRTFTLARLRYELFEPKPDLRSTLALQLMLDNMEEFNYSPWKVI
jgi:hypothetical protein